MWYQYLVVLLTPFCWLIGRKMLDKSWIGTVHCRTCVMFSLHWKIRQFLFFGLAMLSGGGGGGGGGQICLNWCHMLLRDKIDRLTCPPTLKTTLPIMANFQIAYWGQNQVFNQVVCCDQIAALTQKVLS